MKLKNLTLCAAIVGTFAGLSSAHATFGVTMKTTTTDLVDTAAARVFHDAGFTDALNVDTPAWLVIDLDGDGIWTSGNPGNLIYDGTETGLRNALIDPDDLVAFEQVNGPLRGRLNNAVLLPEEAQVGGNPGNQANGQVKPAYALIFGDADFSDGVTFGFNGALTPSGAIPDVGNVTLRIGENTAADTFVATAVVIPEPSAAAFVGLGLASLALLRRRLARS